MSQIRFRPNFKSVELHALALPVEVRKPNLALVKKTLTSQAISLEAGTYMATAKLPAGQELYNEFTVVEGHDDTVDLLLDPEDEAPYESQEAQRYLVGMQPASLSDDAEVESLGTQGVAASLRVFIGNLLQGQVTAGNVNSWLRPLPAPAPQMALFECAPGDINLVQLLQPGLTPLNVALPVSPQRGCRLILTRLPDGQLSLAVRLENAAADTLLHYYEHGLLEQAALTMTAPELHAKELLESKVSDPIAAALGAYTLLRLGNLDDLHDWTKNLRDWFQWLPDGVPIRAEHLARLGEHTRAFQTLLALPERGLPIFSDGLAFVINRLRFYLSLEEQDFPGDDRQGAVATLEQVQRFATFVNFRRPLLTFTGVDPTKPDAEPIRASIDDSEGLAVAPHLG